MPEAAISFDAQDVLECLVSSSRPLALHNLVTLLPWVHSLPSSLRELIDLNLIQQVPVQFTLPAAQDSDSVELETLTLYVPSSSNISLKQRSVDSSAVIAILSSLEGAITQHGTTCIPIDLIPASTRSSLFNELEKLRSLRLEYASELKALNSSKGSQASGANDERPSPATNSSELSRMEEHKRNKEKVRLDARELLQALAGLMAEHNNVTIPDVISDYKSMV